MSVRVLVAGSGAREHAILWKLSQSRHAPELYCAPGNGGTGLIAENVPIQAQDIETLGQWALDHAIDLAVIGPEDPLAAGIADHFRGLGLPVFGPGRAGARIEASKSWAKQLMRRYGVPTASSETFSDAAAAEAYVRRSFSEGLPIVVKADGLAVGKGVVVAATQAEALDAISRFMRDRAFGDAGAEIVIEQYLAGVEVTLLAFVDGATVVPMAPACDYKRIFDGDRGPNTGGMGGYSPPRFMTKELLELAEKTILGPIARGMAAEGIHYSGVLYAGLMITADGPKVIEFNCRFGDPETQVILPRLKSDLLDLMLRVANGKLDGAEAEWLDEPSCAVVLASGGYPGEFTRGHVISGLNEVDAGSLVFHAGTARRGDAFVTSGGRVLTVVATGKDMAEARTRAYRNAARITFEGCHYRQDIALREV